MAMILNGDTHYMATENLQVNSRDGRATI